MISSSDCTPFLTPVIYPSVFYLNRSENTTVHLPRLVIDTCCCSTLGYVPRSASMLLTFSRFISLALSRRTFFRHYMESRSCYFVLNESINTSCLPTSHTGPEGCTVTYVRDVKSRIPRNSEVGAQPKLVFQGSNRAVRPSMVAVNATVTEKPRGSRPRVSHFPYGCDSCSSSLGADARY